MALEKLNENVELIQELGDQPNSDNGLSAEELKALFDRGASIIKNYLNRSVVPYINLLEETNIGTRLIVRDKQNSGHIVMSYADAESETLESAEGIKF